MTLSNACHTVPFLICVYAILETQVVQFHAALLVNWSVAHFFTFSSPTLYSPPIYLSLFLVPYSIINTITVYICSCINVPTEKEHSKYTVYMYIVYFVLPHWPNMHANLSKCQFLIQHHVDILKEMSHQYNPHSWSAHPTRMALDSLVGEIQYMLVM